VAGTGDFNAAVNWSASAGTISAQGVFTAPNAAGPVTVTATSAPDSTKSGAATVTVTSQRYSGFSFKGITLISFNTGAYLLGTAKTSEDALASTGSNWAGVLTTQVMPTATSNTIGPNSETLSDADLIAAIAEFHAKGVKVMLKPHVDVVDQTWRGAIHPSDVNGWFASYTTFITHYAQLAQANGAEMLCFGTEFATMTGAANQTAWNNVIAAIRSAGYAGKLVYAANATWAGDEFTSVSFWDNPQLDVIGLDGYFPLTNQADPTVAQLVAAWSSNKNGENVVADVLNFAAAHPSKPVIFTEIGYMSVSGTNTEPYNYSHAGAVDQQEQANCYEAMYEVWSRHSAAVHGNFWWSWPVPAPNVATDTDYTPWNKLAQGVLQVWQ
jgi:hypothetical protein